MNKHTETTPISNIIRCNDEYREKLHQDSFQISKHRDRKVTCIGLHEQKFGKCDRTWISVSELRRFHIWETDNWRVYVHNVQGASLEVPVDFTPEQAMKAWEEYRNILLPYSKRTV